MKGAQWVHHEWFSGRVDHVRETLNLRQIDDLLVYLSK